MTDCELISKIINQVGIIDEEYCSNFAVLIADTSIYSKYTYRRSLNEIPIRIRAFNIQSCQNFKIDICNKVMVKPVKYPQLDSDYNFDAPVYPFEIDQCFEIEISSLYYFKEYNAMSLRVANKSNSYLINFIFNIDQFGNLTNIKIVSYFPNKDRPGYKDLSKKYPTLKSKYWESFGLPDK